MLTGAPSSPLGGAGGKHSNGLAQLAGGWTDEDLQQFEQNTEGFGHIDDELWG